MKTLAAIVAVVAVLAPTAYATGQALDPRVPQLKRQIKALTARVDALSAFQRCETANQQPIARYSFPVMGANGQPTTLLELDYPHGSDPPHGYVPYPPQPC